MRYAVAFALCFATAVLAGSPLEGTWTGTLEGQPFTLVLKAGGQASFLGQQGRWQAAPGGVSVTDAEGTTYAGKQSGSTLVFQLEDGPLTLSRAAPAKPLPALKPKKALPGKRVTPEGTQLSVVVPTGFKGAWSEVDGQEVFAIQPAGGGESPAVFASARQLAADEAQATAAQLFAKWSPTLAAGTTLGASTFSVKGHVGDDVELDGAWQGQPARLRLAVVRMGDWGIVFLGLAPKDKAAQLGPLFETVVASLDGQPPKAPIARAGAGGGGTGGGPKQLARCWQESVHSTSAGGGGSSTTVRINADGTYHWRSRTSMPGYLRVHEEPGTWSAGNGRITLVPQDGCETVTYTFGFQGYALVMQGIRYIPCD